MDIKYGISCKTMATFSPEKLYILHPSGNEKSHVKYIMIKLAIYSINKIMKSIFMLKKPIFSGIRIRCISDESIWSY